jgi:hypothetical protein
MFLGETRNVYKILVVKPEGKTSLERPRRRWEDNTDDHVDGVRLRP